MYRSGRRICRIEVDESWPVSLDNDHPRFGPLYSSPDLGVDMSLKRNAWLHILNNSAQGSELAFTDAIAQIIPQAREAYSEQLVASDIDFGFSLIQDGCLFLQLALRCLGCAELMGYATDNSPFSRRWNKAIENKFIEASLYYGNQLPTIVLTVLMDQQFFQNVVDRAAWSSLPTEGLFNRALFEMLVLPSLWKKTLRRRGPCMNLWRSNVPQNPPPIDLLHCAKNVLISSGNYEYQNEDEDGDDYDDDEEEEEEDGNRRSASFPSATELKNSLIHIRKLHVGDARKIVYKHRLFWADLYLPAIGVDSRTESVLRYLKKYDDLQPHRTREVSAYLRFMSEIIRTKRDARLLHKMGVIKGKIHDVEKLPRSLRRLNTERVEWTPELTDALRQVEDHSTLHYKDILNFMMIMTLFQCIFSVLLYIKSP